MDFKLNKKNYKEITYILNKHIIECKANNTRLVKTNVYGIRVIFHNNTSTSAVFNYVDRVQIEEYNSGLKISIYKGDSLPDEFFYSEEKEIYAKIYIDGAGSFSRQDILYNYASIIFFEEDTDIY